MKKVLSVLALGLLAAACVPHDPDTDETFIETNTYLEPVRQAPAPRTVYVQQPAPAPQQVQVQPVVVQAPAQPQPTWWQQNKQKHVIKVMTPTCPCKDPNDPCTHCYQK